MKKLIGLLSIIFITTSAHAYSYPNYYCNKNFKTVNVGDSIDTVRAACGDPSNTNTKQIATQTPVNVVVWVYTLGLLSIKGVSINLPSLTIKFSNNQIIEIDRNNTPITAGGMCNINGVVNIGDNMGRVLAVCGNPNFINQQQIAHTTTKQITEWTYNFGPYSPQVIFDFDNNGILTTINMGSLGN